MLRWVPPAGNEPPVVPSLRDHASSRTPEPAERPRTPLSSLFVSFVSFVFFVVDSLCDRATSRIAAPPHPRRNPFSPNPLCTSCPLWFHPFVTTPPPKRRNPRPLIPGRRDDRTAPGPPSGNQADRWPSGAATPPRASSSWKSAGAAPPRSCRPPPSSCSPAPYLLLSHASTSAPKHNTVAQSPFI